MVSVAFPAFFIRDTNHGDAFSASVTVAICRPSMPVIFALSFSPNGISASFPKCALNRATESDVHTTLRGYRKATSVYAAITGLGGDTFIIDDPQKPVDAQSDSQRKPSQ
jgi:hypothetical protein